MLKLSLYFIPTVTTFQMCLLPSIIKLSQSILGDTAFHPCQLHSLDIPRSWFPSATPCLLVHDVIVSVFVSWHGRLILWRFITVPGPSLIRQGWNHGGIRQFVIIKIILL